MSNPPAREIVPRLDPPQQGTGIGVIAPYDYAIDRELWQLVPSDVTVHVTRTPQVDFAVGLEQAAAISDSATLAEASATLSAVRPATTVYLCTSGSFVHGVAGEAKLRMAMEAAGAVRAVTTSGALLDALAALGVKRVGVGTPYDLELTTHLDHFLEDAGVEPVGTAYLGMRGRIPQVSAETVRELAHTAAKGADAVFLACTNLPTIDLIPDLEHELGVPVLSATLVSVWSALLSVRTSTRNRPEQLFARAGSA
jgi:maleate isomerase